MIIVADENIPAVAEAFSALGEVRLRPGRSIRREDLCDAQVLLIRAVTRADARLLEGTGVRFVATATAGFDHVDVGYLREKAIGFSAAPGCNASAVADYVGAVLVDFSARYAWPLEGRTLAVIGFGQTGSRAASRARALGMRVAICDPPLARDTGRPGFLSLEAALDQADAVTLHVPLIREGLDKTIGMAGSEFFNRPRPGAFFVNASRGEIVNAFALRQAIVSGRIRAAAVDVWENEPTPDPELIGVCDFATPHIAGYSLDGKYRGTRMIQQAAARYFGRKCGVDLRNLPAPPPSVLLEDNIEISCRGHGCGQQNRDQALARILANLIPLRREDEALRAASRLPKDEYAKRFDAIRKQHEPRREFSEITLACPPISPELSGALRALGFNLAPQNP